MLAYESEALDSRTEGSRKVENINLPHEHSKERGSSEKEITMR